MLCYFPSAWEDLYADDLVIITDLLEECVDLDMERSLGEEGVEGKCRQDKRSCMICATGLDLLQTLEVVASFCYLGDML